MFVLHSCNYAFYTFHIGKCSESRKQNLLASPFTLNPTFRSFFWGLFMVINSVLLSSESDCPGSNYGATEYEM